MMNKMGFGFLRLPMNEAEPDYEKVCALTDAFLAGGGSFFDTAYTYLDGKSEEALAKCLTSRYSRERYQLSDKLPGYLAKSWEDNYRLFEESARRCGVEWFDLYMLHWLNEKHYAHAEKYRQFDFLKELKAAGKAKRIGFSFHDTPQLLDTILTRHPEVDCVLLQINYLDWESAGVQSRLCYETALRHGKAVLVMEPAKGGALANVPEEAARILGQICPDSSPAHTAIRFAQSLPGVERVLSGMNTLEQLKENLRQIEPMNGEELALLEQAAGVIREKTAVGCTGCGYCLSHCPKEIPIPRIFRLYNEYHLAPRHLWKLEPAYTALEASASCCIGCGTCAHHCPQKLPIPETLQKAAEIFEKR